jgi:ribonuclease Z
MDYPTISFVVIPLNKYYLYGGEMGEIVVLGSSNAVPSQNQENTHLLVRTASRSILIDCGNNPLRSLENAGVGPNDLTDLILTHFHPDHVASAPLLLMGLWLQGRKAPLRVYGLTHTIDRMEQMMVLYEWEDWPDFYPVHFQRIPDEEGQSVLEGEDLRITGSPVKHLIPALGLRFEFLNSNQSAAYSSDTEPSEVMVRLAEGVDVLIHEATGASVGHSSAEQAGEIAERAGARSLWLIHYGQAEKTNGIMDQARKTFSGPVFLAEDHARIDLSLPAG